VPYVRKQGCSQPGGEGEGWTEKRGLLFNIFISYVFWFKGGVFLYSFFHLTGYFLSPFGHRGAAWFSSLLFFGLWGWVFLWYKMKWGLEARVQNGHTGCFGNLRFLTTGAESCTDTYGAGSGLDI